MPASPTTSKKRPRPVTASSRPARNSSSSWCRPTKTGGIAEIIPLSRPHGKDQTSPLRTPLGCRGRLVPPPLSDASANGRGAQLGSVRLQTVDQLLRAAERRQVAAVHLVRCDAQSFLHDAAHELDGEEAVVATQQESGRYVRPGTKRPRLLERCAGLMAFPPRQRRGNHVGGNIMEERDRQVEVPVGRAAVALVLLAPR